jgi:hypothetical protein
LVMSKCHNESGRVTLKNLGHRQRSPDLDGCSSRWARMTRLDTFAVDRPAELAAGQRGNYAVPSVGFALATALSPAGRPGPACAGRRLGRRHNAWQETPATRATTGSCGRSLRRLLWCNRTT